MTATTGTILTSRAPGGRILNEGYGPGAWHGPDLKAALADVTAELAYRRPAEGRHNIAEIALHHAYCTRAVRAQVSGSAPEPFVLEGEDWFTISSPKTLPWTKARAAVEREQQRLLDVVTEVEAGRHPSPISETERFNLLLGITCHAVYHAGQVQLIKRLIASEA